MAWTDEKRAAVVAKYTDIMTNEYDTDEARANATIEVVKELAEEFEEAVNGVRIMLTKAGVYIKAAVVAKTSTAKAGSGTKRVSKAEAQQELTNAIAEIDPTLVDDEIISKLTGKAAEYFTSIIKAK